jgi:hypothetical protein
MAGLATDPVDPFLDPIKINGPRFLRFLLAPNRKRVVPMRLRFTVKRNSIALVMAQIGDT